MTNLFFFLKWFQEINPHYRFIDCSDPENVLIPDGRQYRIINHVLGWTDLTDEEIYKDAPIIDGLIYIVLFDLMCPYDKSDRVFYVIDRSSVKFFELDRIQNIIDKLSIDGAIVLVNGYFDSVLIEQLKAMYPKIILKNWSYVLYKDSQEMQLQGFTTEFDCNIISLLAGRSDIHRYWLADKLKEFSPCQVNITEKSNAYEHNSWSSLLYDLTGKKIRNNVNPAIIKEVPGYNTDNKFNPSIFEFTLKGAVSIVSESVFFYPTPWITGRTLIPLSCSRPFVLVAPPRTLEFLKSFGFQTFSAWWDESYDTVDDPSLRMSKISKIIDYIASLSNVSLKSMLLEMEGILNSNKELVSKITQEQNKNL